MRVIGSDVRIERPAVHAHLFFAASMSTDCVVAAYREELKKHRQDLKSVYALTDARNVKHGAKML